MLVVASVISSLPSAPAAALEPANGVRIEMMGQGVGEWFTLVMTAVFCYCTDRNFKAGAIMCAIATFLQLLTGIPTIYNAPTAGKQPTITLGLT